MIYKHIIPAFSPSSYTSTSSYAYMHKLSIHVFLIF